MIGQMKRYWAIALHNGTSVARTARSWVRLPLSRASCAAWLAAAAPVLAAPPTPVPAPDPTGAPTIAGFERVSFPAEPGFGVETLNGLFRRPPGTAPVPVVVVLHGCGGLWGRAGDLGVRDRAWADILVASGRAVLFPDSFGSRGLGSQCRNSARLARASRERPADARAAFAWLAHRPDVDPTRIYMVGFSNGGSTVLSALRRDAAPAGGDYRAAIAFYPGCRPQAASARWTPRIDLLILIGEADDWTPAAPCHTLAEHHADRVTLVGYPGAYHGFDHPSSPVRLRRGLAYTAAGGGEAHVGSDPAARADAIDRVAAWLDAHSH